MFAQIGEILLGTAACVVVPAFCIWLCYHAALRATVASRDGGRRTAAVPAGSLPHRCLAKVVFCRREGLSLVLDALVEECEDGTVPSGMPFALRVARPTSAGRWVSFQLETFAQEERLVLVELQDGPMGPQARLLAGDLALILKLEDASGWPALTPN